MKLKLGYNYKKVAGLIRVELILDEDDTSQFSCELRISGASYPLAISNEYLLKNRFAAFGINTYRLIEQPFGGVNIELFANGIYRSTLNVYVENDPRLWLTVAKEFKKLPIFIGLPINSSLFSELNHQELPLFDESYVKSGFVVRERFFDAELMNRACDQLDEVGRTGFGGYIDGTSMRIRQLHTVPGAIADIFTSAKLRKLLEEIYQVSMVPCQTLAYKYGSQQGEHSDFVHLTAYPQNLMCGVWIAFEDVEAGSGELSVYEGSHKLPRLVMDSFGLGKVRNDDYSSFIGTLEHAWREGASHFPEKKMLMKKGDLLIWDGNLIHAGNKRVFEDKTRKSVVLHFFGKGAACYYDATGEIGFAGELMI